jgi:hypothetical protein
MNLPGSDSDDAEPTQQSNPACPVWARFNSAVVGPEAANCKVASGNNGAARMAQYRIVGLSGDVTVGERFETVDDPYGVVGALKPWSDQSKNLIFNDCYKLETKQTLPPDFRLVVHQYHQINGADVSKNKITFAADGISWCFYKRVPGKCDWSTACRRS